METIHLKTAHELLEAAEKKLEAIDGAVIGFHRSAVRRRASFVSMSRTFRLENWRRNRRAGRRGTGEEARETSVARGCRCLRTSRSLELARCASRRRVASTNDASVEMKRRYENLILKTFEKCTKSQSIISFQRNTYLPQSLRNTNRSTCREMHDRCICT